MLFIAIKKNACNSIINVGFCKAISAILNTRIKAQLSSTKHLLVNNNYSRCYYSTNNNNNNSNSNNTHIIDGRVYEWNNSKSNSHKEGNGAQAKDRLDSKPITVKRIGREPKKEEIEKLETVGEDEMKISGVNAVLSVFNTRKDDIIKIYLADHLVKNKQVGEILKFCAVYKRAYRIVKEDDLMKLTRSTHHEGIVAVIKQKTPLTIEEAVNKELKETEKRKEESATAVDALYRRCILVLDGVSNHHNIGAILRACVSFNVTTILYSPKEKDTTSTTNTTKNNKDSNAQNGEVEEEGSNSNQLLKSMTVMRVAEGAAEHVNLVTTTQSNLISSLNTLKANHWKILVSTSKQNTPSIELWSPRCQKIMFPPTNVVLVVGSENEGVSNAIQKVADEVIRIPTMDFVESLNVSQATSVLLAEIWRLSVRPAPKKLLSTPKTTKPKPPKEKSDDKKKSARIVVDEVDFEGETDFLDDNNYEDDFFGDEQEQYKNTNTNTNRKKSKPKKYVTKGEADNKTHNSKREGEKEKKKKINKNTKGEGKRKE